jgi:hypothetical protein
MVQLMKRSGKVVQMEMHSSLGQAVFQGEETCGSPGPWAGLRSGTRVDKRCSKQRGEGIEEHSTEQNSHGLFTSSTFLPPLRPLAVLLFPRFLFQVHVIHYSRVDYYLVSC